MKRALGSLIAGAVLLLACQSQAVSATAVYAVTYGGALYSSTDGASTWRQVPIPGVPAGTFNTWLGIDPVGNINLTLDEGGPKIKGPIVHALFRSVDGGQTWSQTNLPANVSMLLAVDPTAPNILYGFSNSGFVRSTDSGATFGDTGNVGILEIGADPQQPGVLYAPNPLRKSTDYGSTWTLLGSPASGARGWAEWNITVDPHNSNVLYLPASGPCAPGVTNCGLFHSADGGTTWDTVNIPGSFYNVAFDSKSGAIYAAGVNKTGQVVKSADGGKTWTTFSAGLPGYAVKVYLDPNVSSTLYAGLASGGGSHPGGVWVSTNSGAAWKLSPVAPAPDDVVPSMGVASGTPPPGAVAVPVITSLAPSSTTAGGPAFTLAVTGAGFLSGAAVQWNGSPLSTTFSSAAQLSAAVPANLVAAVGSANIAVSNPDGTVSTAVSFAINPVGITISANGVVNGASQAGGAVSAGEIVIVSGAGFGSSAQAVFDGVTAPRISAQAGQLTVVVPYEVNGNGSTQLQVSDQGQTSSAVAIPVAAAAPGIFTADGSGSGQGVIFNEDGTANAPGNAAAAGSTVVVSATGEGQTVPTGVDGKTADASPPVLLLTVTATVGGLDAMVVGAGGVPGMIAGYLQVSVQIPPDVTVGDSVAIVLHIGGIDSQGNVTLAIQ